MTPVYFSAEILDVKLLHNILKAISFQEFAVMRPLEEGLKITVDDSKSCETSVYIPADVFAAYYIIPDEDVIFKISLKVLTECLHIFGDEGIPSLKLSYKAPGSPLSLIMKHSEENITVDCQLSTMSVDDWREVTLAELCNINNVIFNGEQFVDVLSDLDMTSDEFELSMEVNPPNFRIKTSSILGDSMVDISKHSETVTIFQCKSDFSSKYAFSNLRQILKVMSYANKISISTGTTGLLGIQLKINSGERQLFVEYYITALFEDD